MSNLIVVAYDKEDTAEQVLETLQQLQVQHLVDLEDAVYVTRNAEGKVKLHQSISTGAAGAAGGALWGMIFGLFFFVPFLGAAIGAGAGYLAGKMTDVGVDDKLAKQLGEKLNPGTSALFVLVRSSTPDKVLPEISKFGGDVMQTSLPQDLEDRLRAALAATASEAATPTEAPAATTAPSA